MIRWLPWRSIVRRAVLGQGFIDPFVLLARMQEFAQPSEVSEPIELLRAGAAMHARGLINSRVIQNNLDWVWPYWVCRQVDPRDPAFLPRAFSITQINLTHRNWTATGLPDCEELPIVDPRGLVTPFLDGWSLDAWILADDGRRLFPSHSEDADQRLLLEPLSVRTRCSSGSLRLESQVEVVRRDNEAVCQLRYDASTDVPGWLVISLRPVNTEGVSFVDRISLAEDRRSWAVDERPGVIRFARPPDRHHVSQYREGDVTVRLSQTEADEAADVECKSGMAVAAASYRLDGGKSLSVGVDVPLARSDASSSTSWKQALEPGMRLEIPDERLRFLFEAAKRTLVLLSPDDVYPGPSTYRRFWFRDAAFMINALACAGLSSRAQRALRHFPERRSRAGYFHSQNGEWDSNGAALWAMQRFCSLTGQAPDPVWTRSIVDGARWIARKRVGRGSDEPHAGLLPPGFSAEHLGPNDYYYWDDFWSVAGLDAAAEMATMLNEAEAAAEFQAEARDLQRAINASLEHARERTGRDAMPASPYRRLDAGTIGSIAAGYPLQIFAADDPRLLDSVEFLLSQCTVHGGFFHNIIHSGINAYLTLHIAQVLLRAGDARMHGLVRSVAELASPTGQWPEAIHPHTRGGCMGDGQHGWAAAEWIMILRNSFVREEGDRLIIGAGIAPEWLTRGERLRIGPAPTSFGDIDLEMAAEGNRVAIRWCSDWRRPPAGIDVTLPRCRPASVDSTSTSVHVNRDSAGQYGPMARGA